MKHSRQICTQDKKEKKTYTQRSSIGQVTIHCINITIINMQKNVCLTWHHCKWVEQPRLPYLRKFFCVISNKYAV